MDPKNKPTWRARRNPSRDEDPPRERPATTEWRESGLPPVPLAEFDGVLDFDRLFRGHTRYRVEGSVLPRGPGYASRAGDPISKPFRLSIAPAGMDEVNSPEHVLATESTLLWFGVDGDAPASGLFQISASGGFDSGVAPVDCQTLGELSYVVKLLRRGVEAMCQQNKSRVNLVFAFGYSDTEAGYDLFDTPAVTDVFGERVDAVLRVYVPLAANITAAATQDLIREQIAQALAPVLSATPPILLSQLRGSP